MHVWTPWQSHTKWKALAEEDLLLQLQEKRLVPNNRAKWEVQLSLSERKRNIVQCKVFQLGANLFWHSILILPPFPVPVTPNLLSLSFFFSSGNVAIIALRIFCVPYRSWYGGHAPEVGCDTHCPGSVTTLLYLLRFIIHFRIPTLPFTSFWTWWSHPLNILPLIWPLYTHSLNISNPK